MEASIETTPSIETTLSIETTPSPQPEHRPPQTTWKTRRLGKEPEPIVAFVNGNECGALTVRFPSPVLLCACRHAIWDPETIVCVRIERKRLRNAELTKLGLRVRLEGQEPAGIHAAEDAHVDTADRLKCNS